MQKQYIITENEAEELQALREFFHEATGTQSWAFNNCKGSMRDAILGQAYAHSVEAHPSRSALMAEQIVHTSPAGERWVKMADKADDDDRAEDTALVTSDHLSPDFGIDSSHGGYFTVLGYLALFDPLTLAGIDDYPEATQRDGFWLTHRCRENSVTPLKVEAPFALKQHGIGTVNAYPKTLLERRFAHS